MPILYILCGPAGCGKTTWAFEFTRNVRENQDIRYVSRDSIRFEMLGDDEDYFAHEKEVFRRFTGCLTQTLVDGFDVIADATHLNPASRKRLTQAIDMRFSDYQIVYVVFNTNVETCVARNANRSGRANVPDNVIRNMCRDFQTPSLEEDKRAIEIVEVP